MSATRRALHFVFKIGNRSENASFYRKALGMKFLRHEEFEEGCKASCNGPYDGKWSKSMVGYGPEDDHFVMELTYNYGIGTYKLGNDFRGITIASKTALENSKAAGFDVESNNVKAPDGYMFTIVNGASDSDKVSKVTLACSNLQKSTEFWTRLCGMTKIDGSDKRVQMHFVEGQCQLELEQIDESIDRATAFGRFAISCPSSEMQDISDLMTAEGQTILTPLVSLDTPGKATVKVIIVADPDGHEICFVGDEAFRELSQVDPKADELLDEAMAADKSDEWFAKKGKTKASA